MMIYDECALWLNQRKTFHSILHFSTNIICVVVHIPCLLKAAVAFYLNISYLFVCLNLLQAAQRVLLVRYYQLLRNNH